jgi:hypothetical protein
MPTELNKEFDGYSVNDVNVKKEVLKDKGL